MTLTGSGWYCGDNYPTDNFNLVYETPTQAGYIEDDSKFGQDNYWLADPLKGGKINYDGSNEVEYDYDYNDQKNFPGAVKLWKKDGSNTGWYKVYNNCEDGIGKDGKVGCYLHFYCLDWNTDDLGSDC